MMSSISFFTVLMIVFMNSNFYAAIATVNVKTNIIFNEERQANQDIRSALYLIAEELSKDSVWFDCLDAEDSCFETDEDDYYPFYLNTLGVQSNSIVLNGTKLNIKGKKSEYSGVYELRVKYKNKESTRLLKRNSDLSVSFSIQKEDDYSGYIPSSKFKN